MGPSFSPQWLPVNSHVDGDAVLAVDFEPARPDRGLGPLLSSCEIDAPIFRLRTDALPARPAAALIADWVAQLAAAGHNLRAVVGYCAGAPLAFGLARESGPVTPPVVVLDPEFVSRRTILYEFGQALGQFKDVLPTDDIERGKVQAQAVSRDLEGPALVRELVRRYAEVGQPAFEALGLDPAALQGLQARLGSYLNFLVMMRDLSTPGQPGRTHILMSENHHADQRLAGSATRFPLSRAELVNSREVLASVAGILRTPVS